MTDLVKPRQVVIAGRIMWTLWGAGGALILVGLVSGFAQSQPGTIIRTVQFVIAISLLGLLVRAVLMGKNWARILYALMACFVLGVVGLTFASKPELTLREFVVAAVLVLAYSTILLLLFHRESASWFRRGKQLVS